MEEKFLEHYKAKALSVLEDAKNLIENGRNAVGNVGAIAYALSDFAKGLALIEKEREQTVLINELANALERRLRCDGVCEGCKNVKCVSKNDVVLIRKAREVTR